MDKNDKGGIQNNISGDNKKSNKIIRRAKET